MIYNIKMVHIMFQDLFLLIRTIKVIPPKFKNYTISSVFHHLFFFNKAKILLKTFLTFDPPPTFDGKLPSLIVTNTVL